MPEYNHIELTVSIVYPFNRDKVTHTITQKYELLYLRYFYQYGFMRKVLIIDKLNPLEKIPLTPHTRVYCIEYTVSLGDNVLLNEVFAIEDRKPSNYNDSYNDSAISFIFGIFSLGPRKSSLRERMNELILEFDNKLKGEIAEQAEQAKQAKQAKRTLPVEEGESTQGTFDDDGLPV